MHLIFVHRGHRLCHCLDGDIFVSIRPRHLAYERSQKATSTRTKQTIVPKREYQTKAVIEPSRKIPYKKFETHGQREITSESLEKTSAWVALAELIESPVYLGATLHVWAMIHTFSTSDGFDSVTMRQSSSLPEGCLLP